MADAVDPHDLIAERAVLGGVMIDPSGLPAAAAVVGVADYYRVAHRHVWLAMLTLHGAGHAIDFVTLRSTLDAAGHLDEVSAAYLSALIDGVPRAVNVPYYAGIVAGHARSRALLRTLKQTAAAVLADGVTPETIAPMSAALARASARPADLQLTALGDLLAEGDDSIEWLVEERFAIGSVNLLAGRPKSGKSTMARALALAVARGDRWLGSRCRFGRVVYVALEDKRSEVRRHLRRMGAAGDEPIRFLIGTAPRTLLADLDAVIGAGDAIDLLVIDTAQKLLGVRDTNDYALVTTAFAPVLDLARARGTCIVLVHHAGKADRMGIEAILGSTAWTASVDNVMIVNRTDRLRVVSTVQRIGSDLDEVVVLMDDETGDVRLGGSRWLAEVETIARTMAAAVRDAGAGGVRRDDLLADIGARRDLKLRALKWLADDPAIERAGTGAKGDPFVYLVREPPSGPEIGHESAVSEAGNLTPRLPEPRSTSNATPEPRSAVVADPDSGSMVPHRAGNQHFDLVQPTTAALDCGSRDRAGIDAGSREPKQEAP